MNTPNMPPPPEQPDKPGMTQMLWLFVFGLVALTFLLTQQPGAPGATATVPYSDLKTLIRNGDVREVTLEETAIVALLHNQRADGAHRVRAITPAQHDVALLPLLEEMGVTVTAQAPRPPSTLIWLLPWVLIIALYFWLSRRMMGGMGGGLGGGIGDFLSGRSSKPAKLTSKVTFADVAGQDEAKREVSELVEFLRDPDRFQRVGATVPHGVLLMGPTDPAS
jgi:cell division protease FtsH